MNTLIRLFILVCFVCVVLGDVWLGTGRGVIRAVPSASGKSYTLQEVSAPIWGYIGDGIEWTLDQDSRFPNGVFITNQKYPGLVWDTQAYQFTPGTNVNLHTKKSTLVDTKNQRWQLNSANQLGIIYNVSMVANVTQSGSVVLAKKSDSVFQKFYPVDTQITYSLTIVLNGGGDIQATVSGPLGSYDITLDRNVSPTGLTLFYGSIITFHVSPPYVYAVTGDAWITVPPPPTFQKNTPTQWLGTLMLNEEYDVAATLTFLDGGSISGDGSDTNFGYFTATGTYGQGLFICFTYDGLGSITCTPGTITTEDAPQISCQTKNSWDNSYGSLYLCLGQRCILPWE